MVIQGVGSSILKNALWCFPEEAVYGALVAREIQVKTKERPNQAPTSTAERSRVCDAERLGSHTAVGARIGKTLFGNHSEDLLKLDVQLSCTQQFSARCIPKETHARVRRKTGKTVTGHCILGCHTPETIHTFSTKIQAGNRRDE